MIQQVANMVVPILAMLGIGFWCRKKSFFDERGLEGLKSVISRVCLPVVLFDAFFRAQYEWRTLAVFFVVYCGFGAALAVGYGIRRIAQPYQKFMPFLLSSAEGGMLGYALFGVLTGKQSGFATVDLGQTIFAYTIFLATLKKEDGAAASAGGLVRNMIFNPCFIGMSAGVLLGALETTCLLESTAVGTMLRAVIEMIKAPTGALVLLVVGYELKLQKQLLGPVIKTVLCRLLMMAVLLLVTSVVIFSIFPFDKQLQIALMILYSLPAPFIIPLFARVGKAGEYISTTLSVQTLVCVLLFSCISVYHLL